MQIYTDGSCHTQLRIGAWAAIILWETEVIELVGHQYDTTHNAMEILAVLKAIDFILEKNFPYTTIEIISDSQYVVRILERKQKLVNANFLTKKNKPIRNVALVKKLIKHIDTLPLIFTKIKAHQKKTSQINYNRVADQLARTEVRKWVYN